MDNEGFAEGNPMHHGRAPCAGIAEQRRVGVLGLYESGRYRPVPQTGLFQEIARESRVLEFFCLPHVRLECHPVSYRPNLGSIPAGSFQIDIAAMNPERR